MFDVEKKRSVLKFDPFYTTPRTLIWKTALFYLRQVSVLFYFFLKKIVHHAMFISMRFFTTHFFNVEKNFNWFRSKGRSSKHSLL